jgi:hypothetical protein
LIWLSAVSGWRRPAPAGREYCADDQLTNAATCRFVAALLFIANACKLGLEGIVSKRKADGTHVV